MKKILKRQSQAESKYSKSFLGQKIGLAPGLESCEVRLEREVGLGVMASLLWAGKQSGTKV